MKTIAFLSCRQLEEPTKSCAGMVLRRELTLRGIETSISSLAEVSSASLRRELTLRGIETQRSKVMMFDVAEMLRQELTLQGIETGQTLIWKLAYLLRLELTLRGLRHLRHLFYAEIEFSYGGSLPFEGLRRPRQKIRRWILRGDGGG